MTAQEKQLRVLVVDDEAINRKLLRLSLKGYDVIEASDGQQAVELARELRPVLVFMDLMMPVMDGVAAAQALKADPATAHIAIIAVSARALPDGAEAYFQEYRSKPLMQGEIARLAAAYGAA